MGSKEILTLQFGHYSNFVGAHWWNLQEQGFEYSSSTFSEINHDVLYREGVTGRNEVTFTPRLVLVDLQGSLKTLPEKGDLYEPLQSSSDIQVEWDEDLVDIELDPTENKNEFQKDLENPKELGNIANKSYNFEEEVSVWSDFLYSKLHPRTVTIIKEYKHCNENTPFDAFPLGTNLWKSQFGNDLGDKIRNYLEECDNFQGFHILTDCTNAFAGLTSSCLEDLRDEYDRKSILVLPVIPSHFPDNDLKCEEDKYQSIINDSVRVLNMALSFKEFGSYSSLFVPLSAGSNGWRQPGQKREFYHTDYNNKLAYHSSAILASALDTFTMKHRLKTSNFTLMDLSVDLSQGGRKAAAASLCLPFSIGKNVDLLYCLDKWEGPLSTSITPNCTIGTHRLMQHITLRGVTEDRLKKPPHQAREQRELPAYKCNTITEMLNMYLSYSTHATASNVTVVYKPLDVKTPYPKIFDKFVGQNGNICSEPRQDGINVEKIPILAGLHSGFEVGEMLESLHTETRKIKIARFHQFTSGGIEKDEFEECLDNLFTLRENYDDNYVI